MLDDADVVDEGEQVVGAHADERRVDAGDGAPPRRECNRLGEHRRGRGADGRPCELRADPSGFRPCGRQLGGILDVVAHCARERSGVGEGDDLARARGEHVARVPVGRRDDAAAGRDSERERTRRDLLELAVRRDEDVRRGEQVGDVVDGEVAVVELDMLFEPEVDHGLLESQPVPLAFVRPAMT